MADAKITALTALGAAPATGDLFPIVDISDTTDAATGTTKKMTVAEMNTQPVFVTDITTPIVYGDSAANGDISIHGTSSATKTTSYVLLQPTSGNVGINTSAPDYPLHVAGTSLMGQFGSDPTAVAFGTPNNTGAFVGGYGASVGSSTIYFGNNMYWNGTVWTHPNAATNAGLLWMQLGAMYWNTATAAASGQGTTIMNLGTAGNLALGMSTTAGSARIHAIATTEQMRLGYDVSNYFSVTIDSTANATFNLTASSGTPLFKFSDAIVPATDGGTSLGSTTLAWQNLFGNNGFVFNLENGNWIATHSTGVLTVGTGDLRVTTAGSNTASVVTVGGTQTLTAKTLTSPSIASPTITTEWDFGAHTAGFTETDNGNSGGADLINWQLSNNQKSTLTFNCTFTFTAPTKSCSLVLKLVQDATGSRTVTWPATVHWSGGTAPTLTTTASRVDIITFYWDGTTYFGSYTLNYVA